MPAFERAVQVGADGVELDVRLTSDHVPIVFHYFYLDGHSDGHGPVCSHSLESIQRIRLKDSSRIPTLREVLDELAGRVSLEIELKGPEPEAPQAVAEVLAEFRSDWQTMEITSKEPSLLRIMRSLCEIPMDLLTDRSEPWMQDDFVAHSSIERARLAGARAVHLHPTQLTTYAVDAVRAGGVDVHAWDVNEYADWRAVSEFEIPRFTTDRVIDLLQWRDVALFGERWIANT